MAAPDIPDMRELNSALMPLKAQFELLAGHLPTGHLPAATLAYDKSADRLTQVRNVLNQQLDFFANVLAAAAHCLTDLTNEGLVSTLAADIDGIREKMNVV